MDAHAEPRSTVSNLVMTFDEPAVSAPAPMTLPRSFSYDLLALDEATDWVEDGVLGLEAGAASHPQLPRNDAEFVRERRSAFEIAFLMLAAALAILVATPPLVQLFLALRGIQA
jgi:hypothetical protein